MENIYFLPQFWRIKSKTGKKSMVDNNSKTEVFLRKNGESKTWYKQEIKQENKDHRERERVIDVSSHFCGNGLRTWSMPVAVHPVAIVIAYLERRLRRTTGRQKKKESPF